MRIIAIGDIHGCRRAFDTLLEAIDLRFGDTLITLGDYVDRGPDSRGVLDRLIALDSRRDISLVPILGNHDQMLLDARHDPNSDWKQHYGRSTLASYGDAEGELSLIPEAHWAFLERCVEFYDRAPRHFFVHANCEADTPLDETPAYLLRWEKLDPARSRPHQSGKIMICGHTSQKSGQPLNLGHALCIDTWVYGAGWLTALDVGSGQIWMARQSGELKMGFIDD